MEDLPPTASSPVTKDFNFPGLPEAVEAHCVTFASRDYFSGVEPEAKPKPTPRVFLGCHVPLKATVSSSHDLSGFCSHRTPPARRCRSSVRRLFDGAVRSSVRIPKEVSLRLAVGRRCPVGLVNSGPFRVLMWFPAMALSGAKLTGGVAENSSWCCKYWGENCNCEWAISAQPRVGCPFSNSLLKIFKRLKRSKEEETKRIANPSSSHSTVGRDRARLVPSPQMEAWMVRDGKWKSHSRCDGGLGRTTACAREGPKSTWWGPVDLHPLNQ
ncbi:hypothetical protein B0J18DRAFT_33069 [Chaetomium sp. MPI-SDFR-AT-0129]|nr:hypothetical protein B0J18DRAFT_33069 [Chaetomium sp. MPI-SDFR-AT-0129]